MPLGSRRQRRSHAVLASVTLGMALSVAAAMVWSGTVKAAPEPPRAANDKEVATDDLQRSLRLDNYTVVADSGPARGETIYFYKCWMCHNKYTKSAPYLKDLYQRKNLVTGAPVSDDTVTAKIKEGGPGMPAFRTSLSDSDIADLRAYFHSGKCCVEGENPPANPWYRAETHKWPVQSGLTGGATGVVRIKSGDSPEGVGVQLVAPNGVRTTVYTDAAGRVRVSQDAGRFLHLAHCQRPSRSSHTGERRFRSTARRSSTTSCWNGLPPRTICRRHRS